uniref:Aquaporin n=2 Tax=Choreotrichia TaxID=141411 RepID=A0A7S3I0K4_9SPIT
MDSERGHSRKLLVAGYEFLGQIFFMYIATVSGVSGSDTWGIAGPLGLFVVVNIFGGISGGHFNPAVTLGVYVREAKFAENLVFMLMYIVAQVCGAIVGCLLATLTSRIRYQGEFKVPLAAPLLLPSKFTKGYDEEGNEISLLPALMDGSAEFEKNEIWEVVYMEIMPTFVFVLFILYVTGKKTQASDLGTFGVFGICLNLWALCNVDWYTGASMNPALAVGQSIFQYWHWEGTANRDLMLFYMPFYMIGAAIGGCCAGGFYHFLAAQFPDKDEHEKVHQSHSPANSYNAGSINQ